MAKNRQRDDVHRPSAIVKYKIRQNIWGNWNGYAGTRRVEEFGTDTYDAREWLLKHALFAGPVRALGGGVYDINNNYLMTTTEMFSHARIMGLTRTDSGGSPTWIQKGT